MTVMKILYHLSLTLVQTFVSLQVVFKKPVSLTEHPKVNEWLTCVESEMRTTLATLLAEAVTEVQQFNSESIDGQQYMKWVDGFQVRWVLCLIHMHKNVCRFNLLLVGRYTCTHLIQLLPSCRPNLWF